MPPNSYRQTAADVYFFMSFLPSCQVEPDLEEQHEGSRAPKRVLSRPEGTTRSNDSAGSLIQTTQLAETRPPGPRIKRQVVMICGKSSDKTYWAAKTPVHPTAPLARRRGLRNDRHCTCESCPVTIYQNLNQAYWALMGAWRRYIPLYGIVKVEEIEV